MLLSFGRENQMKARTREPLGPVQLRLRRPGVVRSIQVVLWHLVVSIAACGNSSDALPGSDAGSVQAADDVARIVSLVPSLAELVIAIGAEEMLVARTDYDTHPAVADLPSIGGGLDPSLEALVELDIDVVLMPEGEDMPALAARLGGLGISAVGFRTETVDDLYDSIERLGVLVDRIGPATTLSGDIAQRLMEISEVIGDRPLVSVMYVIWSDPPMTTAAGSYIDEVISIAGGYNVFSDAPMRWPTVGYESMVRRNPSVIIWPRGADSEVTLDAVKGMPGWRDLEAVQDGRVVFVDSDRFNRPGPELADAAMDLARALHPTVFGGSAR